MTTESTQPQPELGPAPDNGQGQSQGHRRRRRRRKNKSSQQGAPPNQTAQQAQPQRVPHLVDQLPVRRDPGAGIQVELDHHDLALTRCLAL